MVTIYPVIEFADLLYAHRYGWLKPLAEVAEGVMLRPEPALGKVLASGLSIKQFLVEVHSIPMNILRKLKVMLDHGIMSSAFVKIFGFDKTPQNIIEIYTKLNVDYGLSHDVPARLYLGVAVDRAIDISLHRELGMKTKTSRIYVDPSVDNIINEIARYLAETINPSTETSRIKDLKNVRAKLRTKMLKEIRKALEGQANTYLYELLRKLSITAVSETVARFKTMIRIASYRDFKGLIPVVQGLFEEDVIRCVNELVEIFATNCNTKEFTIAIGTGGRNLSSTDKKLIRLAIDSIEIASLSYNTKARIHLLGWSSPRNIDDPYVLRKIYSADSLSARRRAVEGKIYLLTSRDIKLIHVSLIEKSSYICDCPVCKDPILRSYVLDPSGARRNDARLVHNTYVLMRYINSIPSIQ